MYECGMAHRNAARPYVGRGRREGGAVREAKRMRALSPDPPREMVLCRLPTALTTAPARLRSLRWLIMNGD